MRFILLVTALTVLVSCNQETITPDSFFKIEAIKLRQIDFDGTSTDARIVAIKSSWTFPVTQSSTTSESTNGRIAPVGTPVVSIKSGLWSDPTVWNFNQVPDYDDSVIISVGHTVTIDENAVVGDALRACSDLTTINGDPMPAWLKYEQERFYHAGGLWISPSATLIVDYVFDVDCKEIMDETTGFINGGVMLVEGKFIMAPQENCFQYPNYFSTNHNNDFINLGVLTQEIDAEILVGDDLILVDGSSTIHNAYTGSTGDDFYLVGNPYVCGNGYLQIEDVISIYDLQGSYENISFEELVSLGVICPSLNIGVPSQLPITMGDNVGAFYPTTNNSEVTIYYETTWEELSDRVEIWALYYPGRQGPSVVVPQTVEIDDDGNTWALLGYVPSTNNPEGSTYQVTFDLLTLEKVEEKID